jgi:hypothetical protein
MLVEWALNKAIEEGVPFKENEPIDLGMSHGERASAHVSSNFSIYEKNDVFMEVCGHFENSRGILGAAAALLPSALIIFQAYVVSIFVRDWIRGTTNDGFSFGLDHDIVGVLFAAFLVFSIWLFKKLAYPIINKDYFTTRRILIRFNRVTRKVYIHRPKYAGGVKIYDWDSMEALLDNQGGDAKGDGRLVVGWSDYEARKMIGGEFVGRATGNEENGKAWWEYIRRYMEEGAESVPKPFPRLWKGAWPHVSLMSVFYLYPERIRNGGPIWWIGLLILAPIDLLRATLHWIAMLLCVEPEFPPEIENAGQNQ